MKTSTELEQIAEALVEFQFLMPIVPKQREGKVSGTGKNGAYEYSYSYADLGDAVEAAKPHLYECRLAVVQAPGFKKGHDVLTTRVLHASGQWMQDRMRLYIPQETPQVQGSSVTYAKRYAFCAMLRIIADTDDDGTLATMAFGEGTGRRAAKRPPRGSTSTRSSGTSQPIQGRDRSTDGELAMSPADRNKVIRYYGTREDPITKPSDIADAVSDVLKLTGDARISSLVKLSASQGAVLFAELGIGP